jgi:hypothetical protein
LLYPLANQKYFVGTESNTSWTYFIILEAGLTIVAANMPTLWCYIVGIIPERVLRSTRSIISLGSRDGSQPRIRIDDRDVVNNTKTAQSLETNSLSSRFAYPKGRSVESHAMVDLPSKSNSVENDSTTLAKDGIHLNHSIHRTEEQV